MCFGIYGAASGIYMKEMSPTEMVASGSAISEVCFTIGMFLPSMLGLFLGPPEDPSSVFMMKLIIAMPMIFSGVNFFFCMFWCNR